MHCFGVLGHQSSGVLGFQGHGVRSGRLGLQSSPVRCLWVSGLGV